MEKPKCEGRDCPENAEVTIVWLDNMKANWSCRKCLLKCIGDSVNALNDGSLDGYITFRIVSMEIGLSADKMATDLANKMATDLINSLESEINSAVQDFTRRN